MNPSDYIEKAVTALLEEDERIKALFYSHTQDQILVEGLHQTYHRIKQWVERLTAIKNEISENQGQKNTMTLVGKPVYYIKRRDMRGVAQGVKTDTGFKVLRRSYISPEIAQNMYEVVKRLRREYVRDIDSNNCLEIDIEFDNAGQAARFVTGKQVNGFEEWRTSDGDTLKEVKNDSLTTGDITQNDNVSKECENVFTKKKPVSLVLFGQTHPVIYWRDVLIYTCEILYAKKPKIIRNFDKSGNLNKKRPTFSWSKEAIKQCPKQLSFGLWVELNQSAQTSMRICEKMLNECGYSIKDLKVTTDDQEEIYPRNENLKIENGIVKNDSHIVVEYGDRIVLHSYERNEEFNLDIPQGGNVNILAKLAAVSLGKSMYSTVEYNGRYYKIIRIMRGVASGSKMR